MSSYFERHIEFRSKRTFRLLRAAGEKVRDINDPTRMNIYKYACHSKIWK
jgi:hypothetical protein